MKRMSRQCAENQFFATINESTYRRHFVWLLAGCVSMSAMLAGAVSAEARETSKEMLRAAAIEYDDTEEMVLDEIIVTARKRAENILKVPLSMSVVGADDLKRMGGRGLRDLEFAIPNVTFFDQNDLTKSTVSIRGISTDVRNIGTEASFATYLDGILLARPGAFYAAQNDLAQVEVLRGPQGTLFGRNSLSGAMSATSNKPGNEFEGELMVGYGNFGLIEAQGVLNVPIVEDVLAARFSVNFQDRGGFVENVFLGEETSTYSPTSVRGAMRWTPSDDLTIDLSVDYMHNSGNFHTIELTEETALSSGGCEFPNTVGTVLCGFVPGARTIADGQPGFQRSENFGVHLIVDKEFDSGFSVQSLSAYRTTDTYFTFGVNFNPTTTGFGQFDDTNKQFSQEFRLISPEANEDRPYDFVAGLYYLNLPADGIRIVDLEIDFPPEFGLTSKTLTEMDQSSNSYAAYINGNYYVTDKLILNAGIRVSHETKSFNLLQDGNPQFFTPGLLPPRSGDFSETNVSPTVAISYVHSDHIVTYAKWARGFKPGGFNLDFTVTGLPERYNSEKSDLYELGIKSEFLDRRVRINAAAFYQNYSDQQNTVIDAVLQGSFVLNAGNAVSKGAEIEAVVVPIGGLTLKVGYGYTDARYEDEQPTFDDPVIQAQIDLLAGTSLPRSNKHGVSMSGSYRMQLAELGSLTFITDYTYRSSQNFTFASATGSTYRLNGNIVFATQEENWQVELWGRNILNKDSIASVFANQFVGTLGVIYGAPREYGIRLRYRY